MKRCCSINMFSIQANATKSIATNAALPRLRNHLWSIPSAPPLLRQFTNIWNIPHLKNGLRIIYSIIVTLLYRDHPQCNCALSSPLNASLVSLRSSTPEKKTAGESKILFGISRSSKKGRNHLFQNMLLKNGSMGFSLGEVEKLSQELADVEIHCKDGIIRWNRSLLASWSPLLRLQCNWQ